MNRGFDLESKQVFGRKVKKNMGTQVGEGKTETERRKKGRAGKKRQGEDRSRS